MPSNTAAWLMSDKAYPLEIKEAPYTSPKDHEIVIKNHAVAINPIDWMIQDMGVAVETWVQYPLIAGADVAGEVFEVGSAVTRFKVGDRVLGVAVGYFENNNTQQGFQTFTVLLDYMTSPIPDTMSYESASVLPRCLFAAATGMFQKDYLALEYPSLSPRSTGKVLLVWGGAGSVGSNVIQLGAAAGYEVITTASAKNFECVRNLGASQAFDYSSKSVIEDLINALKGKLIAGAFEASGTPGGWDGCIAVLSKTEGDNFVASISQLPKEIPEGISTKFVLGNPLKDTEVSKMVFIDYLPKALAEGKYIAAPEAQVVGKGLESIQAGIDILKNGVSAKKIVVSL